MGFERSYQVKIPSKQLNMPKKKRMFFFNSLKFGSLVKERTKFKVIKAPLSKFYSIPKSYPFSTTSLFIKKSSTLLNPYFLTGFSDAEASFMNLIWKEP
jgi:hypothetical protein